MVGVAAEKPHVVCIPFPAQGHVTPMMKLAKLLHSHRFYITFVNTHYNHKRLIRSKALSSFDALQDFRFESIPDGLPPSDDDNVTQNIPAVCDSFANKHSGHQPFVDILARLMDPSTSSSPPVSCIIYDGAMSFALDAAKQFNIPEVLFWTTSACGFMAYLHYIHLRERGLTPFKDESCFTNGYWETPVDWIPGMKNMRLRDIPSFIRTTDPGDIMLNFLLKEMHRAKMASRIILNTFDDLEHDVLEAMEPILPPVYSIGPLPLLSSTGHVPGNNPPLVSWNLWEEEIGCLEWLEGREPGSVVYVNFGSITVMTNEQLIEFAWGLANSKRDFLWVIRPDLVAGSSSVLPAEFLEVTKGRSLLASWCPQEAVLSHSSVGGFLTHSGWNSTLESICAGVPMLSWPFFAEQQTNCRYACTEWGIGMEIDNDVKREEVEALIRELMEGDKGVEMKKKALEWRESVGSTTRWLFLCQFPEADKKVAAFSKLMIRLVTKARILY